MVLIRTLLPIEYAKFRRHLVGLSETDRAKRLGAATHILDVAAYIEQIDALQDRVIGAFDADMQLIGVVHIKFADLQDTGNPPVQANIGISVDESFRGRGVGTLLLEQALLCARSRGVRFLYAMGLRTNNALVRMGEKLGASIVCKAQDFEARLRVLPPQDESLLGLIMAQSLALVDERLKWQHRKQHQMFAAAHRQALSAREAVPGGASLHQVLSMPLLAN